MDRPLTADHWYRGDARWRAAGAGPGPGCADRMAETLPRYRSRARAAADV